MMIKFKLYYDKDKETVWLNEMAKKGWAMTKFFAGFFTFEKCEPGEYTYQVDLNNKIGVSDEYRSFMEDMDVEIVKTWFFWVIMRKKTADGPFELYTDIDSKIAQYTRIRNMFKAATIIEFICFAVEVLCIYEMPPANKPTFIFFLILLALIGTVLANAAFKANAKVTELKIQKGENIPVTRNASPILLLGLFLNLCSTTLNEVSDPIKLIVQIAAILLMMIGLFQMVAKR